MHRWAQYRRATGRRGEQWAVDHLERSGMRVVDRNWRNHAGELDIVAREGPVLVVAEVKTRTSVDHGHPAEAVDIAKRRRLHALARAWVRQHRVRAARIRVDVIAILAIGGRVFVSHERGVDR